MKKWILLSFFIYMQVSGQEYTLKTISVRDALNTNLIASHPFIDKDGFIWYATNIKGRFYKYDGKNNIEYSLGTKNKVFTSTTFSQIQAWTQDKNNNIWALNFHGVYIINPTTFKIKFIPMKENDLNLGDKKVDVFKDGKGNIWISPSMDYVIRFDEKLNKKIYSNPIIQKKRAEFFKKKIQLIGVLTRQELSKN